MRAFIFCMLFLAFFLLFSEAKLYAGLDRLLARTVSGMDASARQRSLEGRRRLVTLQKEHSVLYLLERQLRYSGVRSRFPKLTAEWWIAGNAVLLGAVFLVMAGLLGAFPAGVVSVLLLAAEAGVLQLCRLRNLRRVNENLLKLLDFLGNYSITSGELTGVLGQVGRYMEEPIRGALDMCCCEAKTTGDTGLALLSMAESIEHPKFKELARNMEVSVRYCADFSAMVSSSRRSMREYLKVLQERKGMMREAFLNMVILLAMSFVMLAAVSRLINFPLEQFLLGSTMGRVALAAISVILLLFAGQAGKLQT